jgi:Xaa-Pro aminopeptidase
MLNGAQIDVLARRHLWKRRWDYQHGTGHGVGYFGAVHEPPVGISRLSDVKFKDGMIVTN